MSTPDSILAFWLDEVGPKGWYAKDDALDAAITERFGAAWEGLMEGRYGLWLTYPSGALAYILLADQFPRNMFRDDARAFASDEVGRAAAKQAIHRGWDLKIDPPARQFFYLPLMHSENLCDQDRCVRLFKERMPDAENNLLHARVHREVIRRFGRFPYRNEALSRRTNPPEQAFLDQGGYGATLRDFQSGVAA
ncbi:MULTISPECIES: DUF924 family protein [unclassified Mameliella]|uniref:DUF924 family protein n=1 Tax=unclassified Mameliella TaxID=2630630 RepID=UPI00273DBE8A|nr:MULTISPECIES: DUF924 family protein [unclassified Mameliella]